jgi:hypothetical protein
MASNIPWPFYLQRPPQREGMASPQAKNNPSK